MSRAGALRSRGFLWLWGIGMAAAGGLQAAALAWPGTGQPLWWLQIMSLAALCAALGRAQSVSQAVMHTWAYATAWMAGTFWWLFISMHTYGGLPAPLAALAVFALAAFLGGYYALMAGLWQRWRSPGWRAVGLFVALWTLAELARGTVFTGFPWGASGYAHVEGPLSVWPRWVGVYGTGALAAGIAMCLAQALRWRPQGWATVVGVLALAFAWVGAAWTQQQAQERGLHAPVSVALLQGNIAQDEKFVPSGGIVTALTWYGQQLLAPQADLVVAPETALPMLPQQLPAGYLEAVSSPYRVIESQHAALIGMPLGDEKQGYTNSAVGWMAGEMPEYRYDKHHLVPFGEFIPPLFHWFVRMMNIPLGDFERGSVGQPSMAWRGERWAPNICYEDLFGEEIGARFRNSATAPTVFVNLSNIAWFGDSIAIDQHLQISRMRALEFERPMLRATNTGATVVIDHRGQVTAALAAHTQGVLRASVQGRSELTPFACWVSWAGLWPLWLFCGVMVAGCAARRSSNHT